MVDACLVDNPSGFLVNGKMLSEEELDARPSRFHEIVEAGRAPGGTRPSCWPMRSNSLGINPEQIDEQMRADKEMGLSLDYDRQTGECLIPDQAMFKKACVANGMHHNNAGYSDATPSDIPKDDTETIDDSTAEDQWENPDG